MANILPMTAATRSALSAILAPLNAAGLSAQGKAPTAATIANLTGYAAGDALGASVCPDAVASALLSACQDAVTAVILAVQGVGTTDGNVIAGIASAYQTLQAALYVAEQAAAVWLAAVPNTTSFQSDAGVTYRAILVAEANVAAAIPLVSQAVADPVSANQAQSANVPSTVAGAQVAQLGPNLPSQGEYYGTATGAAALAAATKAQTIANAKAAIAAGGYISPEEYAALGITPADVIGTASTAPAGTSAAIVATAAATQAASGASAQLGATSAPASGAGSSGAMVALVVVAVVAFLAIVGGW